MNDELRYAELAADEPVCEGDQSLVVGGSAGALPVVERAGSWGVVQRGEHLQQQRIAEASVRAKRPGQPLLQSH